MISHVPDRFVGVGDFEAASASGFIKVQSSSTCRPQRVQLQSVGKQPNSTIFSKWLNLVRDQGVERLEDVVQSKRYRCGLADRSPKQGAKGRIKRSENSNLFVPTLGNLVFAGKPCFWGRPIAGLVKQKCCANSCPIGFLLG